MNEYALAKFLHILVAILALGTSAGLGIVLEFYGDHPTHGPFVLRAIERVVAFFVVPGYVLMLVTGLWMVELSWPWTTKWIQAALALWSVGLAMLGGSLALLHKQRGLFDNQGPISASYRRTSLLGRGLGAGGGIVVITILYLMVIKPWN
ncbi:MAG TPA: DUF2269 family protein [Burkholderiales bacterium]|nr:DUF2269 family protein [Burkholderiales bacterium]